MGVIQLSNPGPRIPRPSSSSMPAATIFNSFFRILSRSILRNLHTCTAPYCAGNLISGSHHMAGENDSCAVRALLAVVLLLTAAASSGVSARRVPLQAAGESDVVEAAAAAKSYSFVLVPLDPAGSSSPNACPEACAAADASYAAVRGGNGFTGDESQNMCAVKKQGKTLYGTGSFSTTKNKYTCSYRPGLKAARSVSVATGVFCACTTSCKGGGLEAEVNCEEKLWSAKTCDTGACSKGCLCRWADSAYDYDLNLFFGYSDPLKPNVCITPAGAQPVSGSAFASSSGSGGGFSSECRQ